MALRQEQPVVPGVLERYLVLTKSVAAQPRHLHRLLAFFDPSAPLWSCLSGPLFLLSALAAMIFGDWLLWPMMHGR